jgi:hypothetical protein
MKMTGQLMVVLLLFYCNNLFGQKMQILPIIEGLTEFDIPLTLSKEWYELNNSNKNYYLDSIGDVTVKSGSKARECSFEVKNGIIIGTNYGEWGGKLIFKDAATEYTILQDNVVGIIDYNNDIYILTGLSHLGISEGKIVKIEMINGKFTPIFSADFESSPETFTMYENELYIVTFNGLIAFDGNNTREILNKQFWFSLYPQSVYVNNNIIAIGMRGCIAIISREDYRIKCYKK